MGHPRILVADDDQAMRELVACALRQDGYSVDEARTGGELLERLADDTLGFAPPVSLIVSDYRMPIANGLTVANGLGRAGCRTPMILMTAFADSQLHADAKRLGVVAVFDKPFDLLDMRTAVRIVLSTSYWRTPPGIRDA